MDTLRLVQGMLDALRSIVSQATYAGIYERTGPQCVSSYNKCLDLLETLPGYAEIRSIAHELDERAGMEEIGFAVEILSSIVKTEEAGRRPARRGIHMNFRDGMVQMRHLGRLGRVRDRRSGVFDDKMRDEIELERDAFEAQADDINSKIEDLSEKLEEARERLEDRIEAIRERFEAEIEENEPEE